MLSKQFFYDLSNNRNCSIFVFDKIQYYNKKHRDQFDIQLFKFLKNNLNNKNNDYDSFSENNKLPILVENLYKISKFVFTDNDLFSKDYITNFLKNKTINNLFLVLDIRCLNDFNKLNIFNSRINFSNSWLSWESNSNINTKGIVNTYNSYCFISYKFTQLYKMYVELNFYKCFIFIEVFHTIEYCNLTFENCYLFHNCTSYKYKVTFKNCTFINSTILTNSQNLKSNNILNFENCNFVDLSKKYIFDNIIITTHLSAINHFLNEYVN